MSGPATSARAIRDASFTFVGSKKLPKAMKMLTGDALEVLATLSDESAQCCVTSPPYFGLRDYGVDGQIGLESTVLT